ncbi:hypothetical protein HHI36_008140 [Cryptolaemus montrouzieri]|uniref:Uncharacterized protein n=1 Tax=Cryptolaemus montrouzieri TaxID=559131 RepID=A0ABD2MRW3_9CUCU
MADLLANRGRLLPNSPNIKGGPQELWPEYKKIIKRKWMEEFWNLAKTKGKVYFEYFKFLNLGTEGWFHGMDRPRWLITTLNCLRSGHCSVPAHLHKIGITDSPLCSCGEVRDIQIFFYVRIIY